MTPLDPAQPLPEPAARESGEPFPQPSVQPVVAPREAADEQTREAADEQALEAADQQTLEAAHRQVLEAADQQPVDVQPDDAPHWDEPALRAAVEAVLFLADEGYDVPTLSAGLRADPAQIARLVVSLADEYDAGGRGFRLRPVAGRWRMYTAEEVAPAVEAFLVEGQTAKLSQAALETLAVIAYQQPVARGRVAAVRGVAVDGVIRTLLSRGLIEDAGQDPLTTATLYRTTGLFLDRLGLTSLEDLPALAPLLPDLGDVDAVMDQTSTTG